jgi:cytochrome c biogenesis protein CcdA
MNLFITGPAAFFAGALTIFSPCVLPLAPVVISGARAVGPAGPLALASGLALTFGLGGVAFASAGLEFGTSPWVRMASALVMVVIGAGLISARMGIALETRLVRLAGLAQKLGTHLPSNGTAGQFALGMVLALAWAPCAGPTLGAAFVLAAQGQSLGAAAATMTAYGFGTASALLGLGFGLSRLLGKARREGMLALGQAGRAALGLALLLAGVTIATGLDGQIEAWAVDHIPDWMAALATAL